MNADTILLTLVGIGIIVVGVMVLMQLQKPQPEVIVKTVEQRVDPWFYYDRRRRGPYYAHLPVRPIVY